MHPIYWSHKHYIPGRLDQRLCFRDPDLCSQVRKNPISGRCRIPGLDSHICTKPFSSVTFRGSMLAPQGPADGALRAAWRQNERQPTTQPSGALFMCWAVNTLRDKLGSASMLARNERELRALVSLLNKQCSQTKRTGTTEVPKQIHLEQLK